MNPNDAPGTPGQPSPDHTIPSRLTRREAPTGSIPAPRRDAGGKEPPAWLVAAMNGAVNLDREWAARYAGMPLLTLFHGARTYASLTTQDGAAGLLVSADDGSKTPTFTFTWGGMLGLRFAPARLSDADRARWLELMRQPSTEPIFLWGQARWESDFLICAAHGHYRNLYAYSPGGTEAAARLTAEAAAKLVEWLAARW